MSIRTVQGSIAPAIADDLRQWLDEGMYGTTIRAGLMGEPGTSSPIYPFEECQLRAAAHIQQQREASINVHPLIWGHEHLCILQELNTMLIDTPRRLLSLPGDKDALS